MSLSDIQFPDDNPFYRIKVRHIFLWILIFGIGILLPLNIYSQLNKKFDFNNLDPILNAILGIYSSILTTLWIWRQCDLVGIKIKYLIGKVPKNYLWKKIVEIIIASSFFVYGLSRIVDCFLSFLFPSYIKNLIEQAIEKNWFINVSKTFSPLLYFTFVILLALLMYSIFEIFLFQGIILHIWATKWETKKAVLALCCLVFFLYYPSIIGAIVSILIYTFLYLKTRTLIVPLVANLLGGIISYPMSYLLNIYWYSNSNNVI